MSAALVRPRRARIVRRAVRAIRVIVSLRAQVACYIGLVNLMARFIHRNGSKALADLNVLPKSPPPRAPAGSFPCTPPTIGTSSLAIKLHCNRCTTHAQRSTHARQQST